MWSGFLASCVLVAYASAHTVHQSAVHPIHRRDGNRIVGGNEVKPPHKYPWQVGLFIDGGYFCGGALISDEYVLTAAHCMDGARSVEVVMGAHSIRQDEDTQVTMISRDFAWHEGWDYYNIQNDIAFIKLPEKVELNDNISPISLASAIPPTRSTVTASGWGRDSDSAGDISPVLREVDVPVMSNDDCAAYYGSIISDGNMCIDSTGGLGTCNGDSGGPLICRDGNGYSLVGLTSFGSSEGCERDAPAAFASVPYYLDWIESKTGITP